MKPLHIIYNLPLPLHHTQHSFARSLTPAYGSLYTGRTSSRNYTVLCAYILLLLRRSARSHAYVLVLVITTAKTGGEPAGDNKTADPIAISAVGTPALSMQVHGTSVQWVLIYGLARPMTWRRWSTAFSDSLQWQHQNIRLGLLVAWFPTSTPDNTHTHTHTHAHIHTHTMKMRKQAYKHKHHHYHVTHKHKCPQRTHKQTQQAETLIHAQNMTLPNHTEGQERLRGFSQVSCERANWADDSKEKSCTLSPLHTVGTFQTLACNA